MKDWEKQSVEKAKVQLCPTFHEKAPEIQLFDNLENVHEAYKAFKTFGSISKSVYLEMLESERGKEILATAKKYHIPYNKDDIDWLHLIDQIENYEELLQLAKNIGLKPDTENYDPIGLRQLIEDDLFQESKWADEQCSDYLETRI